MQKVSSESQGPSSEYEVHKTRVGAGARESVVMQSKENVQLPALAIRENAHPVGRTASTSSLLSKHSTALRCLSFRLQSKLQISR